MSKWGSRERNENGAAVVETALCLCFVVLPLVFATIAYAYMLSFRQTVSQSAAEGARAAAVAPVSADRIAAGTAAASVSLSTGVGGMTCTSPNVSCTVVPVPNCGDGSTNNCVRVTVSYPYRDHSLLPSMPGLGFMLPQTISYSAIAQVN
ncbi:MAG: TadE/TadG family type IV pilus assembly protein [Marmoricola sp.]